MRVLESVLLRVGQANRWQRRFIETILQLMLMVPGRATFRNLSRYSAYDEKTFSRSFGREFDGLHFNLEATEHVMSSDHEQALALDASFISKSGRSLMVWVSSGMGARAGRRRGWRYRC